MSQTKNYTSQFKNKSLEECINEIDKINKQLESDDIPLEEVIKLYRNGKTISNIAQKKLDSIEFELSKLNDE
jgi:exodeoxyribonuclease VII small subunit